MLRISTEPAPAPRYFNDIDLPDRLRAPVAAADEDLVYQAALAGQMPWSPLPAEAGATLRRQLQSLDARTAARALALAALLSLNRAVLMPWLAAKLAAEFPPRARAPFAGYLDPLSIQIAFLLAAFFIATALIAATRPLFGSLLALGGLCVLSAPAVMSNPSLVGGGHLGRIILLALVLRALAAGIAFRSR